MSPRLVRVLVAAAGALVLFGCERLRDVKRCRTLAENVNSSLDTIEAVTAGSGAPAASAYGKATLEYEALAKKLEGFDGGTPELTRAVEEYAAVARSSAHASAALAQALNAKNGVSVQLSSHDLERLSHQEKAIARRIDDECEPR
ncbi:MAG TPA: hypothetical protein VMI54_00540 [Polyangiaceae bacterium]|nr:hypothetical protein [Polyangiaceae bacterium]